jgi:hypothetical protein
VLVVAIYFLVLRPKCKSPAKPGLFSCYCPAGSTLQRDKVSCSAVAGSPGGPCLPGNTCTDSNQSCQGGTCQPCGKSWGLCCDADPKCQDKDHTCIGHTCVLCAVSSHRCCPDHSCNDGSRCNLSDQDHPKCCGGPGTWCCSTGQPCVIPTQKCGPDSGECVACGEPQGPCCDNDPQCPKDYVCENGTCVAPHSLWGVLVGPE